MRAFPAGGRVGAGPARGPRRPRPRPRPTPRAPGPGGLRTRFSYLTGSLQSREALPPRPGGGPGQAGAAARRWPTAMGREEHTRRTVNPRPTAWPPPHPPPPPTQKTPHPSSGIPTGALLVTTGAPVQGPGGMRGGGRQEPVPAAFPGRPVVSTAPPRGPPIPPAGKPPPS